MQLLIGRELVDAIRDRGRTTGFLLCASAPSGTLLARRLVGIRDQHVRYGDLAVERVATGSHRVPFLLAEPPPRPAPWILGSGAGLQPLDPWDPAAMVLGISLPLGHQPYVATALRRQERELLLVGPHELALGARRSAANRFNESGIGTWSR